MYVKPLIIFETKLNGTLVDSFRVFRTPHTLKTFLESWNYMQPSPSGEMSEVLPEFRLGTRLRFNLDDYLCRSDILWGPRFIIGRAMRMDGKRLFVDAPMTKIGAFGLANSSREWREIPFHHGMADAVIDLTNMRQLWPKCEFSRSELARFMTRVARQRYIIRGR